jgi:hypothetical protein
VHVVREGDTLWDLAQFYLSDPFLWPEIYRLNTVVVEDPHWIYPAEELALPGPGVIAPEVPGEARVPGEEVGVPEEVPEEVPAEERVPGELAELPEIPSPQEAQQVMVQGRTVFAAPALTRTTLRYEPTPPLPAISVTEWDFMRASMLVELSELGPRGEVVDIGVPTSVDLPLVATPARYDRIYISHPGSQPPEPGERMLLSRIERSVRPYGRVVRPTGVAVVAAVYEDVSIAVVTDIFDHIDIGNQVTRLERFQMERGVFAQPVSAGPTGELVALLDEQYVPTVEDIVFINVGRGEGLAVGDEFEIYAPSRRADTGHRLPPAHLGEGRVIRVTESTATLRVFQQSYAALATGMPVRLIRKMP